MLQYHRVNIMNASDGSGYPTGMKGDAISLPARMFAIANQLR